MALEIERKFLLRDESWRSVADAGTLYIQGYLFADERQAVRIRLAGEKALLTIKFADSLSSRHEFEYAIPVAEAKTMLALIPEEKRIEKLRFCVVYQGQAFEVDEFLGSNAGLCVAEIELQDAAQKLIFPPWLGAEVTDDPRYLNSNLCLKPYSTWAK